MNNLLLPNRFLLLFLMIILMANIGIANTQLVMLWQHWYVKVGWVMYPLVFMAISLAYMSLILYVMKDVCKAHQTKLELFTRIIAYAAPTLGFIGTIVGLQQGLASFSVASGIDELIAAVGNVVTGLTVSLTSTLWGGIIGLSAGVMSMFFNPAEIDKDDQFITTSNKTVTDTPVKAPHLTLLNRLNKVFRQLKLNELSHVEIDKSSNVLKLKCQTVEPITLTCIQEALVPMARLLDFKRLMLIPSGRVTENDFVLAVCKH
ncbi:MAG: MotA/TolQ/ExbB proton channel family protein [Colwellia sp.]